MSSSVNIALDGGSSHDASPIAQHRPLAVRKVAKEDFRGATPAGLISMILALPSNQSAQHIDLKDAMVKKALNMIRERCQTWIDCFEDEGYIVISARKIQSIRDALQEVREYMLAQSRDLEDNATTLVHRIGGSSRSRIRLKRTEELGLGSLINDGWRGVGQLGDVEDEEVSSSTSGETVDFAQQDGKNRTNLIITKQVLDAINHAATLMRPGLGQKYVRVHLGLRSLTKRKTKGKSCDEYTTPEFRTLMSSATKRGHVSFRLCFGGEELTKNILQHIHKTDNPEDPDIRRFVPLDATIDHLKDVKPRFCLVFFSGNLRIEMDVHVEPAKATFPTTSRGAKRLNLPTASAPRIFRFNKTVDAEIAVACPDMQVDWQLSVDSDLSADKVHDKFRTLGQELQFDPMHEDGLTFPVAHASRESLKSAEIDSVACKVIWTFECVKTPCRVDFAEYYDWGAYSLSDFMEKHPRIGQYDFSTTGRNCPVPSKSCAVSFYGEDWDEKTRNMNPVSGRFAEDFINLFGRGLDGERYVASLLQEIDFLLDVTTQAAVGADSVANIPT